LTEGNSSRSPSKIAALDANSLGKIRLVDPLLNISSGLEGFGVVSGGVIGDSGVMGVEGLELKGLAAPIEPLLDPEDAELRVCTIGRSGVFGSAF
jgi:hypothetical protein